MSRSFVWIKIQGVFSTERSMFSLGTGVNANLQSLVFKHTFKGLF